MFFIARFVYFEDLEPKYKLFLYSFYCLRFVQFEIIQTQRPNNINRKLHRKVTKLKSKFSPILGELNRALNIPTQDFRILQIVSKRKVGLGKKPRTRLVSIIFGNLRKKQLVEQLRKKSDFCNKSSSVEQDHFRKSD